MVLSYLVLIDAYVKRNNTSDDEDDEDSLCDRFAQVFDGMDENGEDEQQRLFYENLTSLNEKNYIDFEDGSYAFDDDMHYEFISLKISEKGEEYARKYMELDNISSSNGNCKKINLLFYMQYSHYFHKIWN